VVLPDLQVPPALQAEADARYGKLTGEDAALRWAEDMTGWSDAVRTRDENRLKAAGSLEKLAQQLQAENMPNRAYRQGLRPRTTAPQ